MPGTVDPKLLGNGPPALLLAGFALLLVGFGFKIAAVPFHSWTPDVYQGAPTPSVAFMASAVKAAAFAGLLRVFVVAFADYQVDWQPYVYALAVATLLVGAVLAVVQTDVKRMLAYSSINHAGFILVGVQAASAEGTSSALFYLAAYTFMVVGSFGVVTVVSRRGDDHTSSTTSGACRAREPVLAFVFAVFLLAQAGVPLTSGFFAKFYVLEASIDAHSWPLAITAMLSAVIAAFLYLRIVVSMYMSESEEEMEEAEVDAGRGPQPARRPCPHPVRRRPRPRRRLRRHHRLGLLPHRPRRLVPRRRPHRLRPRQVIPTPAPRLATLGRPVTRLDDQIAQASLMRPGGRRLASGLP